ncbi:MAG: hypothetical protein Q9191_001550 [Dirinaria sp. TL-2023a]
MAPVKGSNAKAGPKKSKQNLNNKKSTTKISKKPKAPPPVQQKTKPSTGIIKKKRKVYTDKELGIPKLNMITPAVPEQPRGKKKGKVFVDDQQESMMTILAIVNASKEGQIESKMMKSRQMEEIREARRKQLEARQEEKQAKLIHSLPDYNPLQANIAQEETKDSIRRKRKRKSKSDLIEPAEDLPKPERSTIPGRKQVSFAKQ